MATTSPIGNSTRRGRRGFTLVELAVVVFILATVLAIAAPDFVRSYNASQLTEAARATITACQLARSAAVLHQRNVTLHLEQRVFWVGLRPPGGRGSTREEVLKRIELPRQVTVVSIEVSDAEAAAGGVNVRFYPNGTCDPVTLVLQGVEKRDVLTLTVDPVTARATPYSTNG